MIVVVVKNGYSVIDMKCKRVNTVINYDDVFQVLLKNTEVFDK